MRTPYTASVTITPVPIDAMRRLYHDAASRAAMMVSSVESILGFVACIAIYAVTRQPTAFNSTIGISCIDSLYGRKPALPVKSSALQVVTHIRPKAKSTAPPRPPTFKNTRPAIPISRPAKIDDEINIRILR